MSRVLEGKVAIITGAGRGIGRALALGYAAAGAKVVVNDLGTCLDGEANDATPAEEVAAEVRSLGGEAIADMNSVADPAGAAAIVAAATKAFNRLDIVVNNAGIVRDGMFHKMSFENFDSVIKVHLYGSFNVSRAAATIFREQKSGSVVHFTSTAGLIGNLGQANYAAAKLGIVGLSRSIAVDLARYNVRSNCVAPFAVTRMVTSIPGADTPEFLDKRRNMTAEKLVPLVVFLGADESRDVSGEIFTVRGNELFLMSQPRPVRGMHTSDGWTPELIRDRFIPAVRPQFSGLATTGDVFFGDVI